MPDENEDAADSERPPMSTCELDPKVQDMVKFVFNKRMMEQQMVEIGYNAEKLPLGKLSETTIQRGYKVRHLSFALSPSYLLYLLSCPLLSSYL